MVATHSFCKNLICSQKIHLKNNDNTKNNVKMDFLVHFLVHHNIHLPKCIQNILLPHPNSRPWIAQMKVIQ
jgi:hypothetical protein